MKEEALKLADEWEKQLTNEYDCDDWIKQSADMIRKLVAELDKAEPAILDAFNSGKGVGYVDGMRAVKQKPLSDEEIDTILDNLLDDSEDITYHDFARAIQERHGIK